ncbi:hypothetical protein H310_13587 [Aphanomyces invadans]|uniref:VHS domain-containing protein n=1 Tax=Aphanomyces invadans TaxID=157072 RepID=A0A024TD20_9STRA|nr:hypothetical protein H310_13587 [Aphanomyces invadans]ETV92065.1 hypothetical protein H310_13587 [Aphanomyces invadans]|eukprot:XP_008879362.1 hypothetical protein H310_13587 [Aphanomyces invadans]
MDGDDAATALNKGLSKLLQGKKLSMKRKRSRQEYVQDENAITPEAALDLVKKGIRYALNPADSCRRTVAATLKALSQSAPPLPEIYRIWECLFDRSKAFRVELVGQLQPICRILHAKDLYNLDVLKLFRAWDTKFGGGMPQLRAAVSSIPSKWTSMLQEHDRDTHVQAENSQMETSMSDMQFEHMQRQVDAHATAILAHVDSMQETCGILVPTVENCFAALLPRRSVYGDDDDDGWEDVVVAPSVATMDLPEVIASCGLGSAAYSISVAIPDTIDANDLELLRRTLQEQTDEIHKRFLPQVQAWVAIAMQTRPGSEQAMKVRELEKLLQSALAKASEFLKSP